MRTPDNEAEGAESQGAESSSSSSTSSSALADGFGGPGDSAPDENAFGSGWPSGDSSEDDTYGSSDDTSFLQQQDEVSDFETEAGDELSAFEFESDYVPDTDTDWDITGDGVVDHHDFHEATTGFHDFHVDAEDSHGHAQNEGFFHTE